MSIANQMTVTLECNGQKLFAGRNCEFAINEITGLESSELEVSTTDNALVDGATVDGKRILKRPIHIVMTLVDDKNNSANRQRIIKFFNPKYSGKLTVNNMGIERNIEYELEGWSFKKQVNLNARMQVVVDLMCPNPYFKNMDNFGKNMANISAQFSFPWRVVPQKMYETPDPNKGLTLGGFVMGYRTLKQNVELSNDGDVPTGVQIQFIATRGPVTNPKIELVGTGKYIRVVVDMAQGDVLLVDTDERNQIIELNGVNCYQKIDRQSQNFLLQKGDNYLEYDADENYTNLDVNLFYTPMYLGV